MADPARHAAGHSIYEVHEVLGRDPGLDLGSRYECSEYLDAFDFALEFLQEHDPNREGNVSGLDIKHVCGSERQTVWEYRHGENDAGPADLVALWGWDPTTSWQGPTGLTA
jgi:hypothetical protein